MRSRVYLITCIVFIAGLNCSGEGKQLAVVVGSKEKKISLSDLVSRFGDKTIEVDDYYLLRKMRYRAIPMVPLLKSLAAEAVQYDEIVFRCADGYLAHVTRADFDAGKLANFHLAYGEDGTRFKSKIPQGKAEISPEPFYAVATDKASFKALSWPYEVVAIELVDFKTKFPALYFTGMGDHSEAAKGFAVFRKECLKCHSLNLQGGDIGPELNIPRNITEYRDKTFLKAFIRNASSFRAKSKMPSFEHLKDTEIVEVITYLKAMRLYKIGQP